MIVSNYFFCFNIGDLWLKSLLWSWNFYFYVNWCFYYKYICHLCVTCIYFFKVKFIFTYTHTSLSVEFTDLFQIYLDSRVWQPWYDVYRTTKQSNWYYFLYLSFCKLLYLKDLIYTIYKEDTWFWVDCLSFNYTFNLNYSTHSKCSF